MLLKRDINGIFIFLPAYSCLNSTKIKACILHWHGYAISYASMKMGELKQWRMVGAEWCISPVSSLAPVLFWWQFGFPTCKGVRTVQFGWWRAWEEEVLLPHICAIRGISNASWKCCLGQNVWLVKKNSLIQNATCSCVCFIICSKSKVWQWEYCECIRTVISGSRPLAFYSSGITRSFLGRFCNRSPWIEFRVLSALNFVFLCIDFSCGLQI